jgi:outer membrane protein OmpA-like peptidoglycan-associated protein
MKKLHILILVCIGVSLNMTAQEKSRRELKGDKYYTRYAFDDAIDTYTHVKHLSVMGQRRLAESYHHLDKNIESELAYAKLISSPSGVIPEDYYKYAMALKIDGKYDQSNQQMDKFSDLKPADLRAKSYKEHSSETANLIKDQGNYSVVHLDFNTDDEDFGPVYFNNKIVFASSRATPKFLARKYNWNRKPFLDLYVSELDGVQLKKPVRFANPINAKWHDGPASFSNDGTFMAFTRNNYDVKRKDSIVRIEIYFSTFKDGKWSEPVAYALDNKTYSVGHPCLTSDGKTMYFASDMPGGLGGSDIYRTTREANGDWKKAENLGDKINTEGDELFPFYEENNQVLFFSSNGRFGIGGLDVFICAVNGDKFGKVINAGSPVNTQSDDFSVVVDGKMKKGYFSSNRVGGSGDDDIYSFDLLKAPDIGKKIKGIAKTQAGNAIPKTFITLTDDKGKTLDTLTTKEDGAYTFLVESDKHYKLTGKKVNYLDGDTLVGTTGKEFIVKADLTLLTKKEEIVKEIKVDADLAKILDLELKSIYFDLDKYTITPEAENVLGKIIEVMNENPKITVELRSYTDCRGTKEYNQVLSNKRAKVSADYIKKKITKPARIYGKGYGETKPVNGCECEGTVVSTCSDEEHAKNRRTEFIIITK